MRTTTDTMGSPRAAGNKGQWVVTKKFTDGLLKGLCVEELTGVDLEVGVEYKGLCGSSGFVILGKKEVVG